MLQIKWDCGVGSKRLEKGQETDRCRLPAIKLLLWLSFSQLLYLFLDWDWTWRERGKWFIGYLISQPKCHKDIIPADILRDYQRTLRLAVKAEMLLGMKSVICTLQELGDSAISIACCTWYRISGESSINLSFSQESGSYWSPVAPLALYDFTEIKIFRAWSSSQIAIYTHKASSNLVQSSGIFFLIFPLSPTT